MGVTVDAHHHLWQIGRYDYGWITPDTPVLGRDYLPQHFKPELHDAGVDRTVLVQTFHSVDETQWFLDLADRHAFIAGVVGWVDLTDENLDAMLDRFTDRPKLVGIRHVTHDEPDADWLIRDDVLRGLGVLERHGYTFDLLLRPQHLPHVPTLAKAFPELRLVIDHLAKPAIATRRMDGWRAPLHAAAAHPNVYAKLSGLITEADHARWSVADLRPFVAEAVEAFGFDRLMFGSDWPVCRLAGEYGQVIEALHNALGPMTPDEHDCLFGRTARRFYQLPD